jgi:hypothetical protein
MRPRNFLAIPVLAVVHLPASALALMFAWRMDHGPDWAAEAIFNLFFFPLVLLNQAGAPINWDRLWPWGLNSLCWALFVFSFWCALQWAYRWLLQDRDATPSHDSAGKLGPAFGMPSFAGRWADAQPTPQGDELTQKPLKDVTRGASSPWRPSARQD